MTAVHSLIETALFTKLSNDANVASLVGSGANARIYDTLGPDGATLPYIVFQNTAGGDSNDAPRRNVDLIYRVDFWSASQSEARTGAGYLDDALHNQELSITGWSNWKLTTEGLFSFVETVAGKQSYRKGFFLRIGADKNTIP